MRNIIIALSIGLAVVACQWHRTPEQRVAKMNNYVTDELDLNDQQAAKFKAATDHGLTIVKEFQKQREANLNYLVEQVNAGELDKNKLLAMYQEHRSVMDQEVPQIIDELVAFHKSLSPEQKAELSSKLKKIQERAH